MNLLFVAPTNELIGGGEISHYELIKAARQRGHSVHVILPAQGEFAKELKRHHIEYTIISYRWWIPRAQPNDATNNFAAIAKIAKIAKKKGSECIISNSLNIPWGALAAATADLPHVWLSREQSIGRYEYLNDKYDFIKTYANLILTNSKTNTAYTKNKLGDVNINYFYPYVNVENVKLNPEIETPRLVNVGNIMPDKRQLEVIKAASILHAKHQLKVHMLFIGEVFAIYQGYYQELKDEIQKNGMEDFVQFAGFRPKPYELIGANDIFVQTSSNESFGRTTVEAMKLGLTLVSADIPATREVVSLGGGTLYQSGDSVDLAKKLASILADSQKFRQKAQKAQKEAQINLSEAACHEPFFEEIAQVLGQANPRRELRQLLQQLSNLQESLTGREDKVEKLQAAVERRNKEIEGIVNSKAWRSVTLIRKILYRGK